MKNIKLRLIELLKEGYCAPQTARIAKKINEPAATVHYNIKKLEKEGAIKTYKAVFDYKKIEEGFCVYILINVPPSEYEYDWSRYESQIAGELAKHKEVEAVDIIAGEWDLILKIRTKNQDEYYDFLKKVASQISIQKAISLVSLRQLKTNFVLT